MMYDEYSPEGYAEREARDAARELASLDLPPEPNDNLVSESDLPIGAYDDDMADIGIALDRYIRGFDY